MTIEHLNEWLVELGDAAAAAAWKEEHGVAALYLNDMAAGVQLVIPESWEAGHVVERVCRGLRHLLQTLWKLNLVRPVIAVWSSRDGLPTELVRELRRLAWDDERHRGDFTLREAAVGEEEDLLYTLMGDTMREFETNAQVDRLGVTDFRSKIETMRSDLDKVDDSFAGIVLEELGREESVADLVGALNRWADSVALLR